MKKLKIVYTIALGLSLGLVLHVYVLNFDRFSETYMINTSFVSVPFAIFGISGFLTLKAKRPLLLAISWGILSILMLFVFFVIIWPML
jgi:hypothetical protein